MPAITQLELNELVTKDFAPIITLSPIVTPAKMVTSSPIHTLLPILTSPFENSFLSKGSRTNCSGE